MPKRINASIVYCAAGLADGSHKKHVFLLLFQWANCTKQGSTGRKSHAWRAHDYSVRRGGRYLELEDYGNNAP